MERDEDELRGRRKSDDFSCGGSWVRERESTRVTEKSLPRVRRARRRWGEGWTTVRNRQCAGTRAAHQQLFVKFKVTQSPIYRLRAVTSVFNLLHTRYTHVHTHTYIHYNFTIQLIQKSTHTDATILNTYTSNPYEWNAWNNFFS